MSRSSFLLAVLVDDIYYIHTSAGRTKLWQVQYQGTRKVYEVLPTRSTFLLFCILASVLHMKNHSRER